MNLSCIAASLLLLGPSTVSAIFPAPLELRKQGECVHGRKKDLRGEAAHLPTLKVEEHVLTEEECQQLVNTTSEEEFDQGRTVSGVRFFTKIEIAEDVYKKLRDPSLAKDGKLEVSISRVLETSTPHRDGYYGNSGVPEGALVDEGVILLFLNNNYGASFVYGNEKVPVKCGTKVTFNGGHTHNTELLGGGTVKFLGPLTVSSGLNSEDYDGQCENPDKKDLQQTCSCSACDAEKGTPCSIDALKTKTDYSCCDVSVDPTLSSCVGSVAYAKNPSVCPPFPSSTCAPSSSPSSGPSSSPSSGPSSFTETLAPAPASGKGTKSHKLTKGPPASGKSSKSLKSTKGPKSSKAAK